MNVSERARCWYDLPRAVLDVTNRSCDVSIHHAAKEVRSRLALSDRDRNLPACIHRLRRQIIDELNQPDNHVARTMAFCFLSSGDRTGGVAGWACGVQHAIRLRLS